MWEFSHRGRYQVTPLSVGSRTLIGVAGTVFRSTQQWSNRLATPPVDRPEVLFPEAGLEPADASSSGLPAGTFLRSPHQRVVILPTYSDEIIYQLS
jgi:hypothetical protein